MEGFLWGLGSFAACGATAFIAKSIAKHIKKKYSIKDEDAAAMEEMKKQCKEKHEADDKRFKDLAAVVHRIDAALPVMLNVMYGLVITADEGKANGEIKRARELFDDTFKRTFNIE